MPVCRKHIMMIANDTNFIYNLRREILLRFTEEDWRVTVVCEVLGYEEELRGYGFELVEVKPERRGTNPLSDLKLFWQYKKMIREKRPDLVITNNIKANIYAGLACQITGNRYMVNVCGLGTPLENGGFMQKITVFLYRLGIRKASVVFFQNEENRRFFEDRKMPGKQTKAVMLPGSGVNLETHPPLPYPEEETVHFLFAARIMKEKGIDLFLAAAERFHSDRVVFDICGACDDEKYFGILEKAQKDGIVRYHGLQKDLTPFYRQCSCFLYPSYYPEGMSNVLLEAAACARPVIAADRSGCREIVENGKTGYLVPVNDGQATLDAVERFLKLSVEHRRQMGLAGRRKVEDEFDRRKVADIYMKEI